MRPLIASGEMHYQYTDRSPLHFVVAAEFDIATTAAGLRVALAAVACPSTGPPERQTCLLLYPHCHPTGVTYDLLAIAAGNWLHHKER